MWGLVNHRKILNDGTQSIHILLGRDGCKEVKNHKGYHVFLHFIIVFNHLEVFFLEDISSPLLNLLDLVCQEKQLFSGSKSWDADFA